jgi:tRNA (guanine-N1)-methyltransferase
MRFDIVTIFPEYFTPLEVSLLGKARQRGDVVVAVHDLRQWAFDRHRKVDDTPYGGGPGMVMKPEPWGRALASIVRDGASAEASAAGPGAGTMAGGSGLGAADRAPGAAGEPDAVAGGGEMAEVDAEAGGGEVPAAGGPGVVAGGSGLGAADRAPRVADEPDAVAGGVAGGGEAAAVGQPGVTAGGSGLGAARAPRVAGEPGAVADGGEWDALGAAGERDAVAGDGELAEADAVAGGGAVAAVEGGGGSVGGAGGAATAVGPRLIVPTPSGRPFTQELAAEYASLPWLIFACGRYEGIDARVAEEAGTMMTVDEVSIGDYVLAGGEAAVLVMIEAVSRLLPGVLGNVDSVTDDSFASGAMESLLEGPVYTKPPSWRGHDVPEVLLSGNHAAIARWRRDQALRRTAANRPELLDRNALDTADRQALFDAGFPISGERMAH